MARTLIAIAVVEEAGRVLIGRRPAGVPLAGLWEFPGGKVLTGETCAEAAARECLEETGVEVIVGMSHQTVRHDYEHGGVELHFLACRPKDSRPARHPFVWVPRMDLDKYEFPAANAAIVALLRSGESCRAGA